MFHRSNELDVQSISQGEKKLSKQDAPPIHRIFTDRTLALFIRDMLRDEEEMGRSVPGTEARRMLSCYVQVGQSERNLRRVLDRLVVEGYLREDRKELCLYLVGYFCQTKATEHMHAHLNHSVINSDQPDLPIREIAQIASTQKNQPPILSSFATVAFQREKERKKEIEVATRNVKEALASLNKIVAEIDGLSAKLANQKRAADQVVQKLKLRIAILNARRNEEIIRYDRVKTRLRNIVNQSD